MNKFNTIGDSLPSGILGSLGTGALMKHVRTAILALGIVGSSLDVQGAAPKLSQDAQVAQLQKQNQELRVQLELSEKEVKEIKDEHKKIHDLVQSIWDALDEIPGRPANLFDPEGDNVTEESQKWFTENLPAEHQDLIAELKQVQEELKNAPKGSNLRILLNIVLGTLLLMALLVIIVQLGMMAKLAKIGKLIEIIGEGIKLGKDIPGIMSGLWNYLGEKKAWAGNKLKNRKETKRSKTKEDITKMLKDLEILGEAEELHFETETDAAKPRDIVNFEFNGEAFQILITENGKGLHLYRSGYTGLRRNGTWGENNGISGENIKLTTLRTALEAIIEENNSPAEKVKRLTTQINILLRKLDCNPRAGVAPKGFSAIEFTAHNTQGKIFIDATAENVQVRVGASLFLEKDGTLTSQALKDIPDSLSVSEIESGLKKYIEERQPATITAQAGTELSTVSFPLGKIIRNTPNIHAQELKDLGAKVWDWEKGGIQFDESGQCIRFTTAPEKVSSVRNFLRGIGLSCDESISERFTIKIEGERQGDQLVITSLKTNQVNMVAEEVLGNLTEIHASHLPEPIHLGEYPKLNNLWVDEGLSDTELKLKSIRADMEPLVISQKWELGKIVALHPRETLTWETRGSFGYVQGQIVKMTTKPRPRTVTVKIGEKEILNVPKDYKDILERYGREGGGIGEIAFNEMGELSLIQAERPALLFSDFTDMLEELGVPDPGPSTNIIYKNKSGIKKLTVVTEERTIKTSAVPHLECIDAPNLATTIDFGQCPYLSHVVLKGEDEPREIIGKRVGGEMITRDKRSQFGYRERGIVRLFQVPNNGIVSVSDQESFNKIGKKEAHGQANTTKGIRFESNDIDIRTNLNLMEKPATGEAFVVEFPTGNESLVGNFLYWTRTTKNYPIVIKIPANIYQKYAGNGEIPDEKNIWYKLLRERTLPNSVLATSLKSGNVRFQILEN